jgi:hypothetical protein
MDNVKTMLESGITDPITIEQLKKRAEDMKKLISSS